MNDLEPVDERFVTVLRLRSAILSVFMVAGAALAEFFVPRWTGVFAVPALVFAIATVGLLPRRRWAVRRFAMREDELRSVYGLVNRWDVTVPFRRVQHIDVTRSAIERANGLATLVLHTAGAGVSAISVEGLDHRRAESMRDHIRDILKAQTA